MTFGNGNRWAGLYLTKSFNLVHLTVDWRVDLVLLGGPFGTRCFAFTAGPRPLSTSVRDPDPECGIGGIGVSDSQKVHHILEFHEKHENDKLFTKRR